MMFFIVPLYIFGLSLAGPIAMYVGLVPLGIVSTAVILVNLLQNKVPDKLPLVLQNWDFLPEWMRSLDPIDRYKSNSILSNQILLINSNF